MKQTKHTPGPWFVGPNPRDFNQTSIMSSVKTRMGDNIEVANLYGDSQANARLIAAAPNLLTAVVSAIALLSLNMPTKGTVEYETLQELKSAHKMATGGGR